ncbi:LLM class flavin-dependent oxidoreductase [Streptomyces sp. NPDC059708]|uniref:LLM class flavin-dependent oxidoreductase n=1 Tax=Streptomyces sp. NPDC059708 TaxID=3346916 RepID=UPI0036BE3037
MHIGVGLPAMIPGTSPEQLLGWAVQAEESGYASLSVLDRIVYENYEPLVTLAAAAAVTRRIGLGTTVLLAATRGTGAVLAKQAASVHRLSGGRLTLGIAVGGREDDYTATGTPYRTRGRDLDTLIGCLRDIWDGGDGPGATGPIGPSLPGGGPSLLIGGHSDAAMRRAARHARGWISGSGSAEPFAARLARLDRAWEDAGRIRRPRVVALAYFALGERAEARAEGYLGGCYGTGPYARRVIGEALTTPEAVAAAADEYARAGCDELVLLPCDPDPHQLTLLTRALGDRLGAA